MNATLMKSNDLLMSFYVLNSFLCYLKQLVAGQEVSGGLEDGCHGFSQLFMDRLDVGGGVRLGLEDKLRPKKRMTEKKKSRSCFYWKQCHV